MLRIVKQPPHAVIMKQKLRLKQDILRIVKQPLHVAKSKQKLNSKLAMLGIVKVCVCLMYLDVF
uniref:Uncharacterized protein n=1 Tax=Hyaloperonospora arabidopsidis (strain Emoy2) TaxID=559515 RepID=M4BMM7_HYAAE